MAELAGGQGGSDVGHSSNAQAQSAASDQNNMAAFIKRGEAILENFSAGVEGFKEVTRRLTTIEKTVTSLSVSTRKRDITFESNDLPGPSGTKQKKTDATPTQHNCVDVMDVDLDSDPEKSINDDDCLDDIDNLVGGDETEDSARDDQDFLAEVNEFFVTEKDCGPPVTESVANTVNTALRGTLNRDKMKSVLERNKRPENLSNLQIPRVPQTLWDQLKNQTKTLDASRQKLIGRANQALVPVVKAMNHLREQREPDIETLTTHILDTFKILASQVTTTNKDRRDTIRPELASQFKDLCGDSNPASATELFGDNFAEKVKAMDQGKTIKMTNKSKATSFLDQQGEQRKQKQYKALPKATSKVNNFNKTGSNKWQKLNTSFKHSNKPAGNARPNQHHWKNQYM